jgi:hypothetical protein
MLNKKLRVCHKLITLTSLKGWKGFIEINFFSIYLNQLPKKIDDIRLFYKFK